MRYLAGRIVSWTCACLALLAAGCGDDQGRSFGENSFTYEVEYTQGTFILPKDSLPLLTNVETTPVVSTDPATGAEVTVDHHTFTFADPGLADEMEPGHCLVIYGSYMTRVLSKKVDGDKLIVETEPALLTDVVRNGRIAWDLTPEISGMELVSPDGNAVKGDNIGNGFEYKFDWQDRKYTVWMKPEGTSEEGLPEIQVNVTCQKIDPTNGNVTATFGAKGTTRLPRQATQIGITDGQMTEFQTGSSALRSELTFEYVATMSLGGTQAISFPGLTLRIPLESLTGMPMPLPIFVNLGLGFVTTANLPEVTSFASAKVKLILDSDTGFDYKGPVIEAKAKIHEYKIGTANWEIGNMAILPSPLEIRFDLSCPRVGIEIAGSEIAWMAGVFSVRSQLLVPSLCKASLYQVRLDGGYSLSLLGLPIAEDKGAITEVSRTESTPECE